MKLSTKTKTIKLKQNKVHERKPHVKKLRTESSVKIVKYYSHSDVHNLHVLL
jgi:hypothetical protein